MFQRVCVFLLRTAIGFLHTGTAKEKLLRTARGFIQKENTEIVTERD